MLEEILVTCPHCWEEISLGLDLSGGGQDYIEDCPVCCKPMRVVFQCEDGELVDVSVDTAE